MRLFGLLPSVPLRVSGNTSTSRGDLITGRPYSRQQAAISAGERAGVRAAVLRGEEALSSSLLLRARGRARSSTQHARGLQKVSAHAGGRAAPGSGPAALQERNRIAGMVGERWMAGWFQHVCSFPDHQSHRPFGSGCTGDANHAIGGNPASWQLSSERELQRRANDWPSCSF